MMIICVKISSACTCLADDSITRNRAKITEIREHYLWTICASECLVSIFIQSDLVHVPYST